MNHISTNNAKQARADLLENLMVEVEKVFVGKRFVLELAVTSFLAKGHLLIEDIPGVGKTTLAKALSKALALDFFQNSIHIRYVTLGYSWHLCFQSNHS